jgi:hypothetical protein
MLKISMRHVHFIASHQKCWRHVRVMVDCQKMSLANQIAALHALLRMTMSYIPEGGMDI